MGLVEHEQRVARLDQRAVRSQRREDQRVVGDLYRRAGCSSARPEERAALEILASPAVAGLGASLDLAPVFGVGLPLQGVDIAIPPSGAQHHADRTALEHVEAQLGDDLRQAGQVLVEELFLQGHGGGGDDDGLLQQLRSHDGREAVGDRLAGAGARFELREVAALAVVVVRRLGTEEGQQGRMHHLLLAGAGDEAGPCPGHFGVQVFQARAGLLEQAAIDALSSRVGGRLLEGFEGFGC